MIDVCLICVCFQAEDGIRDLVRSRGLGDVYKRQGLIGVLYISILLTGLAILHLFFIRIPEKHIAHTLSLIHI